MQVRSLEQDNFKLSKEIHKWESYQNQEISNIKYVYDQEISSLKDALNDISKQYNQLKLASEGLFNENQEMRDNIARKENGKMRESDVWIPNLMILKSYLCFSQPCYIFIAHFLRWKTFYWCI